MHFLHKTYVFGLIILKRENERPSIVTLCRHFLVCDLRPWDTCCLYVTHFFSYLIVFQWLSRNFDAGQSLWTCFENWICSCLSIRRWGYTHSFKTKRVSFSVLLTNHDNKCASRIKLVAVECWIVCNTFVGIDMKTYNLDTKRNRNKTTKQNTWRKPQRLFRNKIEMNTTRFNSSFSNIAAWRSTNIWAHAFSTLELDGGKFLASRCSLLHQVGKYPRVPVW